MREDHIEEETNGNSNRSKLCEAIKKAEESLYHAKTSLKNNRKILENCKPTEFVQNIDEFKAKVASIFGQIKQDGDILFKVIDEYQNFQDLPSTSNEIPIMEENINTQEFNEPSSSHNLSIDDENETISIKSVKSENSSSQSLDSLLYPELESEVDQLLQVNDETPIIHSQQSPNATRVRHQPTVQSHSISLRNTTNIAAYDLPDERPELMEIDDNSNSINDAASIMNESTIIPSIENNRFANLQDTFTEEEHQRSPTDLVDHSNSSSHNDSSLAHSISELKNQYCLQDCVISLENTLEDQARNGYLSGISNSSVKEAIKAIKKMTSRRTKKVVKYDEESDSDDNSQTARTLLRGTSDLLNDSDYEDNSPDSRKKKKNTNGHSSEPSTSKALSRGRKVDNEVEMLSEDENEQLNNKRTSSNKTNSHSKTKERKTIKSPKKANVIISSDEEENGDDESESNENESDQSDKNDSDEDSDTDRLLKTKIPNDRENKKHKSAIKKEVEKKQSKKRRQSDSSEIILSSGNDDNENSSVEEIEEEDRDSSVQEVSDDNDSPKKKKKTQRVTRSTAQKAKKATKTKKKKEKQPKKRRRIAMDSEDEEEILEAKDGKEVQEEDENEKTVRFRKIISKKKLTKETINAELAEKERRKRLEQRQKEFNGIELAEGEDDLMTALTQNSVVSKQRVTKLVLDPNAASEDPCPVEVHSSLLRVLKPHQAKGIKFIYDSLFERLEFLEDESKQNLNYGGILAHCMGLGKTLQVITFVHTVLTHEKLSKHIKRVLVLAPKNVVINWRKEFDKWLSENDEALDVIDVIELGCYSNNNDRRQALKNWFESKNPSVAIMGYELFRILTEDEDDTRKKKADPKKLKKKKNRKFAELQKQFREYLQDPGADLFICDEAHKLKNDETALSKTVSKIATKRRLCLTGTPLQNNLMEYHCMVNFVKPGILGTKKEFANRFKNIIERGRHKDANALEVRAMRKRCHVLYDHLKLVLDRKDYRVLIEAIPPKLEYLIKIRLTPQQIELYRNFLGLSFSGDSQQEKIASGSNGRSVLMDYHVFSRIWTHPYQLITHEREMERKRILQDDADDLDHFVVSSDEEETSESDASESSRSDDKEAASSTKVGNGNAQSSAAVRKSKRLAGEEAERAETPPEYIGWFSGLGIVTEDDRNNFELSNKLAILVAIIKKCEMIGDKLLVFSQSIESLTLIRRMLEYLAESGAWWSDGHEALMCQNEQWGWLEGIDYLYIDGQVSSKARESHQEQFNDPNDLRARLMLISTRAGSLGTNMIGANRVVIFDACWNPSHDTQSLFRVYRFGQTKPVYIYRLIAQGTMEERIYKRQVTKESTAMRVIDESSIKRHFNRQEVEELYEFDPDEIVEGNEKEVAGAFDPRKDRLLAEVMEENKNRIVEISPHDSLYDEDPIEKMSQAEKEEAWEEYNREKTNPYQNLNPSSEHNLQLQFLLAQQQQQLNPQLMGRQKILDDPLYMQCFGITGMNQDIAARVTYIKRALDELMPSIPMNMRGGINEFGTYFVSIIQEGYKSRETPQWLLNKSISVFRTVVNMVKDVEECKRLLRIIYVSNPQLFEPTTAHLFAQRAIVQPTFR